MTSQPTSNATTITRINVIKFSFSACAFFPMVILKPQDHTKLIFDSSDKNNKNNNKNNQDDEFYLSHCFFEESHCHTLFLGEELYKYSLVVVILTLYAH